MLHPSFLELRERIVGDSEEKDLNRFSLIIGTAKRARQIIEEENLRNRQESQEARARSPHGAGEEMPKPVSQAVKEIYEDKVHIIESDTRGGC